MDAGMITGITAISAIIFALLGKSVLLFRKNCKSCCGITFRSVDNSQTNSKTDSPRLDPIELKEIKKEIKKINPEQIKIHELELKLKEAENKLKIQDVEIENEERVYI